MRKPLPINSRDVAKRAGVSQSTVSKVANNNAHLTAETRARVIRAARELGYVLNARKNGHRVVVIVPEERFIGYVASMLSGISQELLGRGMGMEILPDTRLAMLNERCIDGAIALSWKEDFYREWSASMTLPLVRINGPSNHTNDCYSVCPDGLFSMRKLIDRLWRLRHRRIGFFFFNTLEHEINNAARRLDGFLAAMRAHGCEEPEQYCIFDCMQKGSAELAQQLVQWHRDGMTALIFANALGTGKMMQIIQLTGLKVPEELSLVGWEQEAFSRYTIPPLSTLYPDPEELGKAAVNLLDQMITRRPNLHDVLLPYRWIPRKSLAAVPVRKPSSR